MGGSRDGAACGDVRRCLGNNDLQPVQRCAVHSRARRDRQQCALPRPHEHLAQHAAHLRGTRRLAQLAHRKGLALRSARTLHRGGLLVSRRLFPPWKLPQEPRFPNDSRETASEWRPAFHTPAILRGPGRAAAATRGTSGIFSGSGPCVFCPRRFPTSTLTALFFGTALLNFGNIFPKFDIFFSRPYRGPQRPDELPQYSAREAPVADSVTPRVLDATAHTGAADVRSSPRPAIDQPQ